MLNISKSHPLVQVTKLIPESQRRPFLKRSACTSDSHCSTMNCNRSAFFTSNAVVRYVTLISSWRHLGQTRVDEMQGTPRLLIKASLLTWLQVYASGPRTVLVKLTFFRHINRSAKLHQKTIEALKRIFWRNTCFFFRLHKNPPMKMSCYCGKMRKRPNFGIYFLDVFHERILRFATVPLIFWLKNVLLRARFLVRREVYVFTWWCPTSSNVCL